MFVRIVETTCSALDENGPIPGQLLCFDSRFRQVSAAHNCRCKTETDSQSPVVKRLTGQKRCKDKSNQQELNFLNNLVIGHSWRNLHQNSAKHKKSGSEARNKYHQQCDSVFQSLNYQLSPKIASHRKVNALNDRRKLAFQRLYLSNVLFADAEFGVRGRN